MSAVAPGETVLDVVSTANFLVGDQIVIDKGFPEEETHVVMAISSIITRLPVQNKHKVSATITVKATCQNFAAYYSCPAGTSSHGSANLIECADQAGGVCQQSDQDRCCVSPAAMCQNGIVFDGIKTDYCCEAGCGKCGGVGCQNRPGGAAKCCEALTPKCSSKTDDTCSIDKATPTTPDWQKFLVTAAPTTAAPTTKAPVTLAPVPLAPTTASLTLAPVIPVSPLEAFSPCATAPPVVPPVALRLFEGKDAKQVSLAFTMGNAGLCVMGFACIAALTLGVRAMKQRRSSTRVYTPMVVLEEGDAKEAEVDEQEAPLMGGGELTEELSEV